MSCAHRIGVETYYCSGSCLLVVVCQPAQAGAQDWWPGRDSSPGAGGIWAFAKPAWFSLKGGLSASFPDILASCPTHFCATARMHLINGHSDAPRCHCTTLPTAVPAFPSLTARLADLFFCALQASATRRMSHLPAMTTGTSKLGCTPACTGCTASPWREGRGTPGLRSMRWGGQGATRVNR